MPGPTTEVLNDDIKELKADIKDSKDEMRHDNAVLREDFHRVAVSLAGLQGEAKVYLGIAKWAGAFVLTTALTFGAASIWWASGVNARINELGGRMDERFKATDARFEAMDVRLDRLEASINKVIEQTRPVRPATKAAEEKGDLSGK